MEQSPSWEANSHSASQEIPRLWKPKVYYRVHKGTAMVPTLNQINPVYTLPPYFPKFHSDIISHLRLGLISSLFPSGFQSKIVRIAHLFYTCFMLHPSHPPWFDHPNSIWWSVQVRSSSLCCLLQPPVTCSLSLSLLLPNILLSNMFLNTPNLCSSLRQSFERLAKSYETSIMRFFVSFTINIHYAIHLSLRRTRGWHKEVGISIVTKNRVYRYAAKLQRGRYRSPFNGQTFLTTLKAPQNHLEDGREEKNSHYSLIVRNIKVWFG